jgi:hypothetical protein
MRANVFTRLNVNLRSNLVTLSLVASLWPLWKICTSVEHPPRREKVQSAQNSRPIAKSDSIGLTGVFNYADGST